MPIEFKPVPPEVVDKAVPKVKAPLIVVLPVTESPDPALTIPATESPEPALI